MRIQQSGFSISQILSMLERRELVINEEYQRGSGFWPPSAMTYLIDTILNDFPIPKLFFFERVDVETRRAKVEIIDGQQRIATIRLFVEGKFRLGKQAEKFEGLCFDDLSLDQQRKFLGYPLQVDVILQADEDEVLEMFRRMNSHTTPLNNAEKRHAEFNGAFKWFANGLADEYSEFFVQFGVLTKKQTIRMADAELITDLIVLIEEGIVNQSPAKLQAIYKKYDKEFPDENRYREMLSSVFDYMIEHYSSLAKGMMFKGYSFYTLVAAMLYNRGAIQSISNEDFEAPIGRYATSPLAAERGLKILAYAHEQQEVDGPFGEYVVSCLETTHRVKQRTARTKWQIRALNGLI